MSESSEEYVERLEENMEAIHECVDVIFFRLEKTKTQDIKSLQRTMRYIVYWLKEIEEKSTID